ncbi:MAG TPA: hypothetical protein VH854_03275 [Thermoanaerobaculia bacterium]|nr:hypothetical protein [Thermoanaerobaculia bacterium]
MVALDGTAKCDHCTYSMLIQPSRIRGNVTLPSRYPAHPERPAPSDRS